MININTLNQNNNYSLGKPNVTTPFSTLAMGETTTTTGNMGKLIPIFIKELQPSQTINAQQAINIQFTPFVTNLMHQIKGELISYFVPYRLIWDDWEDFVTGGKDGTKQPIMPSTTIIKIIDMFITDNVKKAQVLKRIREGQKKLEKRIQDYTTTNQIYKKEAAEEAKKWGELTKEKINGHNGNENILDGKEDMWEKALEALSMGYPYADTATQEPNLLAKEMLVYEDVIQYIFLGTPWDYIGLPYSLAHLAYYTLLKTDKVKTEDIFKEIKERGKTALNKEVMGLPFRAYRKIYNDWIRLADWEEELRITIDDEMAVATEEANYDWDYFTRARRYQIRGAMPTIPVLGKGLFVNENGQYGTTLSINGGQLELDAQQSLYIQNYEQTKDSIQKTQYLEFTDIMTAAALMNYFSANARIRPRYAEHLLARWNVRIQDARLQLSEFIGINEISITSQGVVQTSAGGTDQTQQGNITGQLWGNGSNMRIGYKAQEHGIVMTLLVVKPANSYEQGYPAWLKRKTRFDIPTPEMVNLPDMPIKSDELDPFEKEENIIGYKAIYDEYRTTTNKVTGLLRPSNSVGLASYTLARKINNPNIEKITKCRPNLNRVKQYLNQPDFILIAATSTTTSIPLPYTSDVRLAL